MKIVLEAPDSNQPQSRCVYSVLMSCLAFLLHNVTRKTIVALKIFYSDTNRVFLPSGGKSI